MEDLLMLMVLTLSTLAVVANACRTATRRAILSEL